MNVKKGAPGRGPRSRPDSFSYTGVGHGLKNSFGAWMAGEPYWCDEAHEHTDRDPGTKPCLHWMTDGGLKCARCRQGRPVACIGWVPLYREQDSKPIVVIVHESASDLLAGLHYPDFVLVGRIGAKDSVFVRKSDNRLSLVTEKESRKRPVDVVPDLLTMWRMPELNEWLAGQRRAAEVPAEVPATLRQRLSVPPPTTRAEALAIDAEKKADGESAGWVGDVLAKIQKNAKHAEKNGHHKPTTEGGAP